MLQDNLSAVYNNSFEQCRPPKPTDIALIYQDNSVYAQTSGGTLSLPRMGELPQALCALPFRFGFSIGETAYFLADGVEIPASDLCNSSAYRELQPADAVFAAAVGQSLCSWYASGRFCGKCGAEMTDSTTERARVCPNCANTVYPKICPAVIVAVTDKNRLLLTKYNGRAFKRYALVAGFNEIGESIEDTVRREVMEEVGLKVKNLRFYRSQPWVFTNALLMGFFCELDGDNTITRQASELSEAAWFEREDIPDDHSAISLTGEMIELFRSGFAGKLNFLTD